MGGREGKKMGDRTQHEGKTERAKESHDRCSQPPGMRMPKTADLGTQALLVVNSFKLHLNAFNNCIAKMEVGCLKYPGASTIGSQPLDWNNAPMNGTTAQPHHEPPHLDELTNWLYCLGTDQLTEWFIAGWLTNYSTALR